MKIPEIKIPANVALYVAALSLGVSIGNTLNAWKDFYKKNPDAYKKALEEVGGFSGKDLLHPGELLEKWVEIQYIAQEQDTYHFDKAVMTNYDFTFSALNLGTFAVTKNILLSNLNALIEGGLLTPRAKTKTDYLMNLRTGEGSYAKVFWGQLKGTGLGDTFEDKSYRYAAPLLNKAVSLNKVVAAYSSAESDDVNIAMLVGGAGNDSLANPQSSRA